MKIKMMMIIMIRIMMMMMMMKMMKMMMLIIMIMMKMKMMMLKMRILWNVKCWNKYLYIALYDRHINPNGVGLLNVAWVQGGTMWKNKIFFFDFQKVYNELGKVTKFQISRPLISWRKSQLEKVQAHCAPPAPLGLSSNRSSNISLEFLERCVLLKTNNFF